jgi:hypothetical protein
MLSIGAERAASWIGSGSGPPSSEPSVLCARSSETRGAALVRFPAEKAKGDSVSMAGAPCAESIWSTKEIKHRLRTIRIITPGQTLFDQLLHQPFQTVYLFAHVIQTYRNIRGQDAGAPVERTSQAAGGTAFAGWLFLAQAPKFCPSAIILLVSLWCLDWYFDKRRPLYCQPAPTMPLTS